MAFLGKYMSMTSPFCFPDWSHLPLLALQLQVCCRGNAVSSVTGGDDQMNHRLHFAHLTGFNKLDYSQFALPVNTHLDTDVSRDR